MARYMDEESRKYDTDRGAGLFALWILRGLQQYITQTDFTQIF